ncbi:hypothetical protein BN11_2490001 [Nostocoides australiense Ben110]|uniref:Uncharacterized protein n=1 Tax=Nostocoides australiense Ben110 TaxID=1193182 RepID=W6JUZ4_9MICO|nr:hypothetical protein BN11_2490001 [Tetrasphaera australiensis Ben110]
MLLDPEINANALTWAENADKTRTTTNDSVGKGSSLVRRVGPVGLEPTTYGLKVRSSAIELEARSTTLCEAWRRSQG